MITSAYLAVFIQIILAVSIACIILLLSYLFGEKTKQQVIKDSAYECGMLSEGSCHPKFSVKFYVTAMLFILFDIEVVFLIPWVLVHRDFIAAQIPLLAPIAVFMFVLILGLLYEIKKGALEWEI